MARVLLRVKALLPSVLASILLSGYSWGGSSSLGDCDGLAIPARFKLDNVKITAAIIIPAGQFEAPAQPASNTPQISVQVPEICRVEGVAQPTDGSIIGFEVWLPTQTWNGKMFMNGNGGFSSEIRYAPTQGGPGMSSANPGLANGVSRGYVSVATDTGHKGHSGDISFMVGHPEKGEDFAWRAVHETAIAAKAITKSFYGNNPKYSYFTGCSTGLHPVSLTRT